MSIWLPTLFLHITWAADVQMTIFDIYASRPFQWHQEHPNARCFGPCYWALNIRESRRTTNPQLWKCWASPPHLAKVELQQPTCHRNPSVPAPSSVTSSSFLASTELELPTTVIFASAGRLDLLTAPPSIFPTTFNFIIIIDNYHHGQLRFKHRPQSNPHRPSAPSTRKCHAQRLNELHARSATTSCPNTRCPCNGRPRAQDQPARKVWWNTP